MTGKTLALEQLPGNRPREIQGPVYVGEACAVTIPGDRLGDDWDSDILVIAMNKKTARAVAEFVSGESMKYELMKRVYIGEAK